MTPTRLAPNPLLLVMFVQDAQKPTEVVSGALKVVTPAEIVAALMLLVLTALAVRAVTWILEHLAERSVRFRLRLKQAVPLVRILFWAVAVYLVVVAVLRPEPATLVGLVGGSAVALGLAAQDLLKNLFGGLLLVVDRPFQTGDKVRIGEHYGEVKSIGLQSTRLVTPDDSQIAVPNAAVLTGPVSNANSGALDCQVVTEIYLPTDVDLELVRQVGFEAAASSRYAYLRKPIVVIAESVFRETFLVLVKVKAYVLDHRDEFRFRTEVLEGMQEELVARGIVSRELILRRY